MQPLTFGVEEEFLLVDSNTFISAPRGEEVLSGLPSRFDDVKSHEFSSAQIELTSTICTDKRDLHNQLYRNRQCASRVAEELNLSLLSTGTPPMDQGLTAITNSPRYQSIIDFYGPIARFPAVNGCHVHVGVHDHEMAIKVASALRPWLPTLQIMMNNSPIYDGKDTKYSSWRLILANRFPTMGITPTMDSLEDYERHIEFLIMSRTIPDASMVYWWSRPSVRFRTVEVRIGDAGLTAFDSVLMAVITRALVMALIQDIENGTEGYNPPDQELRYAHWRASKGGVRGKLIDLESSKLVSSFFLMNQLWNKITPILKNNDDLDFVGEGLTRIYRYGSGSDRQRHMFTKQGPVQLIDFIAEQTRGG